MKCSGFTLFEIVIVVVIIALIAGLTVTDFMKTSETVKVKLTKTSIQNTDDHVKMYKILYQEYPGSEEGLESLTQGDSKVIEKIPVDGWSRKLKYNQPSYRDNKSYDIYSYGADGREGGEGFDSDIYNE